MEWISDPQIYISLLTLTLLEIVLGIDNVIFISILASKLPKESQSKARKLGLSLALVMRVMLLFALAWMVKLTTPFFSVFGHDVSGRDLILFVGGLFLLGKSTYEIHEKLEGEDGGKTAKIAPSFSSVIIQILLLDIVFSLDSVITAVGMVDEIWVMVVAVVIAIGFMLVFADAISSFIDQHPTLKILALSFLILIGCMLVAESFHHHIPKGYIYFAMAFSVGVEFLNLKLRNRQKEKDKVKLHQQYR